jgi:hypothetical protein
MAVGDAIEVLNQYREELAPSITKRRAALDALALSFAKLAMEIGFTVKEERKTLGIRVGKGNYDPKHAWILHTQEADGLVFWVEKDVQSDPVALTYLRASDEFVGDLVVENGKESYEPVIDKVARAFVEYARVLG